MKIPKYRAGKCTKETARKYMGSKDAICETLNISPEKYAKWGYSIPAPYADRLFLSEWGKKPIIPRHVLVKDALIIFKTFSAMAEHFGKKRTWKPKYIWYLPESESAYMIKHFGNFISSYTMEQMDNYR